MSNAAPSPDPRKARVTAVLECLECGCRSDVGRGWKAYLYENREVWVYCPACAAREFAHD